MLNLARNWKRTQAEEDLLWQIGRYFRSERWALRDLERLYLTSGDTHGLNKLFVMQAEYDPNNIAVENNLAATSLLLNVNLPHAYELAKELYQNHPEEPVIVSTYAYSLYLQNRTAEGLAALEKLKPEKLELPSVAVYYGVLLSAAGEPGRAAKYLKLAQKSQLLPEEKALAAEAAKSQLLRIETLLQICLHPLRLPVVGRGRSCGAGRNLGVFGRQVSMLTM